ncbi:MAG: DUF4260 domain-containing protein [Chitinophagaceae bacterium]|nr:DUF4260 domain-containing protein [Chitinophagaceae bacterium]
MKKTLQREELAQLLIAMVALSQQPISFSWWTWPLLFLSPDISMLGYLINPRAGALCYNLFHHKGIALVVLFLGHLMHSDMFLLAGMLLYAHACFDRAMGYGLKYQDSFNNTHLGRIGKAA